LILLTAGLSPCTEVKMNLIDEILRGMVILSILAVMQHGCSVKDMATQAAKAHQKGLSPYGNYSRFLTKNQKSLYGLKK
jgi:hypothetical protein